MLGSNFFFLIEIQVKTLTDFRYELSFTSCSAHDDIKSSCLQSVPTEKFQLIDFRRCLEAFHLP